MASCHLCYNQFFEEKRKGFSQDFPEICFKYLHPAFKQESFSSQLDDNICPKCSKSAMRLVDLSGQMEFIQNTITELAFTFSLEILHRREIVAGGDNGKNKNCNPDAEGKKIIKLDISALPNLDSWNTTNCTFNAPSELKSQSSENFYTPEIILGLTENETNDNIKEIKQVNDDNMDWLNEDFDTQDKESPTKREKACSSKATNGSENQIKLCSEKKLNFHNDRRKAAIMDGGSDIVKHLNNKTREPQTGNSKEGANLNKSAAYEICGDVYKPSVSVSSGNKKRFTFQKKTGCMYCSTKEKRATVTVTGCSICHNPVCADHQDTTILCPSCKNSHAFVLIPAGDEDPSVQIPLREAPVNLPTSHRVFVRAKNENDFEDDDDIELLAAVTTLEH